MSIDVDPARPRISVVIPAYRAEKTLARTIDSVLDQKGVDVRIIVVVDGNFDRSAEVASGYADPRILVEEHETNRGAAISRNDGLAVVDTDFVMFLDADDFLEGPLLSGLVTALAGSDADVAFGPMQILDEKQGRRRPKFVPDFASSEDIFRKWHLGGIYVSPCSVLWRTEFIRGIGGWDREVTRNDDGELVMRAILSGARIALSKDGCGIYVKHSSESLNHRTDNMASMLKVNEKLIALRSPVIAPAVQRRIFAGHYLNVAWQCYLSRQEKLGDEALRRGRAMEPGTWGAPRYRVPLKLLGVKRTAQIVGLAKRIVGREGM